MKIISLLLAITTKYYNRYDKKKESYQAHAIKTPDQKTYWGKLKY